MSETSSVAAAKIASEVKPKLCSHVHLSSKQINLIFDVIIPFEYSKTERESLRKNLTGLIRQSDPRYNPIMTLEHHM